LTRALLRASLIIVMQKPSTSRLQFSLLAALAITVVVSWIVARDYYKHTEPAPGWHLAVDERGNYAAQHDSGYVITRRRDMFYWLFHTKQAAINASWDQYLYEVSANQWQAKWHKTQ